MGTSCRCRWVVGAALLVSMATPALRADVDENGWIVDWLVYGPLVQSLGPNPGEAEIRRDYLTDGAEFFESTIKPEEGLEVVPDFAPGVAASEGFHTILNGEVATWRVTNATDPAGDGSIANPTPDTVDYNLIYGGGTAAEQAMAYAVVYVRNPTNADLVTRLEVGSDDAIVVKLDDCEALARNVARGFGGVNTVQDSAALTIRPGAHRLLVKVFNGVGGFGFRLRLADPTSGGPAALDLSVDPAEFSVPNIAAVGLALTHTAAPDRLLGLDKPVNATITAIKTFEGLADNTQVTVTEELIPGTSYVAGSGVPAPASSTATSLTWNVTVGDLVANGIKFDMKFSAASCGSSLNSGCLGGAFSVGAGAACTSVISGQACSVGVPLNAIFLGDIVGGGDGTGTKSPDIGGVRIDTPLFLLAADIPGENNDSVDIDADPFQPTDDPDWPDASDMIDGTFFMPVENIIINSAGVEYAFNAGDPNGGSWNHILSNSTHDIDKGVGNILAGGKGPFATGVGVHASAGVTFDLDAIRAKFGAEKVKTLSALVGGDTCASPAAGDGGEITCYILYSTEDEVLIDDSFILSTDSEVGEDYLAPIPANAVYMSFATGAAGNGIGCDHGVWAEARIFPTLPTAVITADPVTGSAPLVVNFSGASSSAPAGQSIACYNWDFGDGTTGSGQSVSHTYTRRGRYKASLSVQTDQGLQGNTTADIAVNFGCGNVAPYTSTDIGAPARPGCGTFSGECLSVLGSGKDIAAAADNFQLVHKTKSGDVSLSANITEATFDAVLRGRAGLMMRDGTAPNAAFASIQVVPQGANLKVAFQSRASTGANVVNKTTPNVLLTAGAAYLKLERVGADFIGSSSPDGVTYTEFTRVTLTAPPAQMLAGFAVTSRDTTDEGVLLADATFCNIKYSDESTVTENCSNSIDDDGDLAIDCADSDCAGSPSCPVGGTFHRGDADNNGQLQLTDAVRILGFLFLGQAAPTCLDAADADDNGQVQLTDAVRILGFLFLGQAPPAPPGPPGEPCGSDVNAEAPDLGCETYTNC